MFRPKFTRQYPEERWNPPSSFRGRPVLVEEEGVERCVACGLCARVCPALAIEVQASETELAKERYPVKFEINMLRCIFCGFCEEACPGRSDHHERRVRAGLPEDRRCDLRQETSCSCPPTG